MKKVAVLGAGSWGTALSIVLADNNHDVRLWSYRKEQAEMIQSTRKNEPYLNTLLSPNIIAYANMEKAVENVSAIIIVVPSQAIRSVCQELVHYLPKDCTVVHATKGIEPETLKRISEMITEELGEQVKDQLVVLSGPSHAEEVALRHPTTVTVASYNKTNAKYVQNLFFNESFRVYTSTD